MLQFFSSNVKRIVDRRDVKCGNDLGIGFRSRQKIELAISRVGPIRVVNMGTSSKMCQRNFVPTPHPGTLEIVPTLRT